MTIADLDRDVVDDPTPAPDPAAAPWLAVQRTAAGSSSALAC
jgi:hypothetical protein